MRIRTNNEIRALLSTRVGAAAISGVADGRSAAVAAAISEAAETQCLIVTASYARAKKLAEDIAFFVRKKVYVVPSEEQIFFKYEAKSHSYLEERLQALTGLARGEDCIVISPVFGAIQKMPPRAAFERHVLRFRPGEGADPEQVRRALVSMGYERVPIVEGKGQFGIRGGIIDVFPVDAPYPCRIELFDTEIDSIRTFDSVSQRSIENLREVAIYPAQMMLREEDVFRKAAERIAEAYGLYADSAEGPRRDRLLLRRDQLLEYIGTGTNLQLLENYIHYFYDDAQKLWDYLAPDGVVVFDDPDRILERLDSSYQETQRDFSEILERGDAVPQDHELRVEREDFNQVAAGRRTIFLTPFQKPVKGIERLTGAYHLDSRQTVSFGGRMDYFEQEVRRYGKAGYEILIACSTEERVRNIGDFLARNDLSRSVRVVQGSLSAGMEFIDDKFVILSDADIFTTAKQRRTRMDRSDSRPISAFTDIGNGDYVVHENHGIGRFVGIEQLTIQGARKDYLKIRYAGEDLLYVPVEQMDIIQKYIGADGAAPKINKLSSGEWKKTKARVKAAIEDMAKDLLALSAARKMEKGYAFSADTTWQREFEDLFPYEETQDQLRSIREIKRDMEKDVPMDRLLCGDVGYGKTEVAARAVFKCIADGKQAAVLVPTTILANQHYYTFKERMENFPFTVEMLSRFRTEKQQEEILRKLRGGHVDVVIGTHRLLSKDVVFKDLGLLVVDEEQRFGVQHKEAIKMLRKNVDVLALSATPIPRTLHMSLVGIRDMSIIEEPPEERYPIQTYVMEQDDEIVREAIYRELDRDGQVYVVFNRVKGIRRIAARIAALVPEARIAVGHGQMNERELEDIMFDFTHHKYNVLVATTIIESGLDIPNVNTMVVMDADRYGLSQLYQLRGRVGRSNRIAYAYLLHQKDKMLTEQAEKRLRAIKEFTEFGSGFRIAMRDLEIRGAGNLLGTEQHGHMMMIGYELYCKLLEEAVATLSGKAASFESIETAVEIEVNAYIPNSYIDDELIKLHIYKKIASVRSAEDVHEIKDEILDRFGDIPAPVDSLVAVSYVRALCERVGVTRIREDRNRFVFEFGDRHGLTAHRLADLSAEFGPAILLNMGHKPYIRYTYPAGRDKMSELARFAEKLVSG